MTRHLFLPFIASLILTFGAQAQEQVYVGLVIKDAKFKMPRFNPPSVRYELRESDQYDPKQNALLDHFPEVKNKSGEFVYGTWPIDKDDAIRAYAHFVIDDILSQDFVPVNEFLLRVQLSSERAEAGPVITELTFDSKTAIANSYKRQVNELIRIAKPTEAQNQSIYSAALSAVTLSPKADNYLLLARALKHSLRTGTDASLAPVSRAELRALPGFVELNFEDQWTVQTEILDTLTASKDLKMPIDRTRTVLDAALEIGTSMIEQIDFENSEQTSLPIVRVYQTLSFLHAENDDCIALQENNVEAIRQSKAISMGWAAQRVLLLDWGTCLELMTGFGSGPSREQLAKKATGSPPLRSAWAAYHETSKLVEDRLALATGVSANRIRDLVNFANEVVNGATNE